MISDEIGQQLHDRATRGRELSPEERTLLEKWYGVQDKAEMKMLYKPLSSASLDSTQEQIDSALSRLIDVTKKIQELAQTNATLRQENENIRRQVAQHLVALSV